MRYFYKLIISGAPIAEVTRALEHPPSDPLADEWGLILEEGPDDSHIMFVDVFLDILDGRRPALESIGVYHDDITIWLLYEYAQQCNMEFDPADMRRLGHEGITLCVSCWREDDKRSG